jgi:hypothetical protein
MARVKKDTIDYFPHPVKNGSKMFIMEQTYGDKGYIVYYKLLESLGAAEGHFLDFSKDKDRLYFCASVRADSELMEKMILTLCEIGAVDKSLWIDKKVIWCQDLLDSVFELYKKRGREIPKKPFSDNINSIIDNNNPLNATEIPHSIVKDSIVEKSKVKDRKEFIYPIFANEQFFKVWALLILEKKWKNKSDNALQSCLNTLAEAPNVEDSIKMMENSLSGNWQGIFHLDKNKNVGNKTHQQSFKPGGPGKL